MPEDIQRTPFAVRRERLQAANITFSLLFGGGAKYSNGEDSLFLKGLPLLWIQGLCNTSGTGRRDRAGIYMVPRIS